LTALYLVPTGTHLFELPNKIGLPQQQYFAVQQIYRGWAWFGVVVFAAIAANFATALMLRLHRRRAWPALAAGLLLVASLIVFFVWTYPANRATVNWTVVPANWRILRLDWELSHALNALLTFLALCCAIVSAMAGRAASGASTAEVRDGV
jgi:hypothetical protein